MSETENTSEQQETQAPDKRRSCKIFLAKAAFYFRNACRILWWLFGLANSF